jgi:acyl carrier protein
MTTATSDAVVDIVSDVLEVPAERLREEPSLQTHGWDSLSVLETLARLESEFGAKFDLRRFTAVKTTDEIVDLLEGELT